MCVFVGLYVCMFRTVCVQVRVCMHVCASLCTCVWVLCVGVVWVCCVGVCVGVVIRALERYMFLGVHSTQAMLVYEHQGSTSVWYVHVSEQELCRTAFSAGTLSDVISSPCRGCLEHTYTC